LVANYLTQVRFSLKGDHLSHFIGERVGPNGKKRHLFSKEWRLRRRNVCERLSICFQPIHFRAESAIAFSWLHPEAAKEINPINPACLA
jgi:hypothetical protein